MTYWSTAGRFWTPLLITLATLKAGTSRSWARLKGKSVTQYPLLCVLTPTTFSVFVQFDRKVKEWASFSRIRTFLYRSEIKDEIEKVQRNIDIVMTKFTVSRPTEIRLVFSISSPD